MMRRTSVIAAPAVLAVALLLSACSGGEDPNQPPLGPPVPPPASSGIPGPSATEFADPQNGPVGTRARNPYPLGATVEDGGWSVVVHSVTMAATDEVLAASDTNVAPPDGEEYIIVNLTITYVGPAATGQPSDLVSVGWALRNSSGDPQPGVFAAPPDPIDPVAILKTGQSVTGNLALRVPSDPAGVLAITLGPDASPVYVASS